MCPRLQSLFLPYELNSWELRKGTKATVFLLTEESDSRQTGNTAKSLSQYWGEGGDSSLNQRGLDSERGG